MSEAGTQQPESFEGFPTIVIARRCKLNPEMLSKWEDMRTFLKLRENRQRISVLSDIEDCTDADSIDEQKLNDISCELRLLNESLQRQ